MDRLGDQLLACPAFARNQNGGVGGGHAAHHLTDPFHGATLGNDRFEDHLGLELPLERLVLAQRGVVVQRPFDCYKEFVDLEGLGQVVEGPELERLDRRLHRSVGRQHDHGNRLVLVMYHPQ